MLLNKKSFYALERRSVNAEIAATSVLIHNSNLNIRNNGNNLLWGFPIRLMSCVHSCNNLWMRCTFPTAALLCSAFKRQVTPQENVDLFAVVAFDSNQQHQGHWQDQRKAIVWDNFYPNFFPANSTLTLGILVSMHFKSKPPSSAAK